LHYILILLFIFGSISYDCFAEEAGSLSRYKLNICIAEYRDGNYFRAIQCIDSTALPIIDTRSDSLDAYKMLAQSYGMLNQIEKAKEYFRLILEKDSSMMIDTLELPPNITLVYNQVLLEKKIFRMESSPKIDTVIIEKKKINAAIPVLLSSAVVSLGGAGFCGYKAYVARQDNMKSGSNHFMSDGKITKYSLYLAGGVGCAAVAGVTTVLFVRVVKKETPPHVYSSGNGITVVFDF
jgi:tetratricopeptide (TPR) repeat protein